MKSPPIPLPPPILMLVLLLLAALLTAVAPIGFVAVPFHGPIAVLLILVGLGFSAAGFLTFKSRGTPVRPGSEPTQLILSGPYRITRNPMYLAVVSMVIGQALLFGNLRVLDYGLFASLITHVFVLTYEEPKLRKTFGAEYETYCANVPRWIPRIAPWRNQTQPTA